MPRPDLIGDTIGLTQPVTVPGREIPTAVLPLLANMETLEAALEENVDPPVEEEYIAKSTRNDMVYAVRRNSGAYGDAADIDTA